MERDAYHAFGPPQGCPYRQAWPAARKHGTPPLKVMINTTRLKNPLVVTAVGLALLCLTPAGRGQDPILELKTVLVTRPPTGLAKDQPEHRRFHVERERQLRQMIDTRLRTFTELRDALMLKEWSDAALDAR